MANTSKPTDSMKQIAASLNAPTPSKSPAPAVITSVPSPTPAPTPVPDTGSTALKYGSKGDAVKNMQSQLITLGYIAQGEDDGAFGDGTLTAVKSFQKVNGLESDGIAGEKTLALLESGTAKQDPDIFVWVDKKGKVYHSKKDCSDMKNPKQIKLSQAEKQKLKPCDKCH
jgi:peptidoglycan hydrolase-like protein with peptidoglycan-binding domain